jgi:hypothetical protein
LRLPSGPPWWEHRRVTWFSSLFEAQRCINRCGQARADPWRGHWREEILVDDPIAD